MYEYLSYPPCVLGAAVTSEFPCCRSIKSVLKIGEGESVLKWFDMSEIKHLPACNITYNQPTNGFYIFTCRN